MGSSFFGRPNIRGSSPSPTSSSSSPATRRGKKNGSEKPKQPQRRLGVAQLEKIRLHGEMSCNSFNNYNPSLHPQEDVRGYSSIPSSSSSFTYALSTPTSTPNGFYPNMMPNIYMKSYNIFGQSLIHFHLLAELLVTFSLITLLLVCRLNFFLVHFTRRSKSLGCGNQNSGSSDSQELDLELRLSL
ncbi:unnamed protein product [Brassica napus]|uniref:(rape) hypothetical protein n=1 Tax=Brassica napus TaxID=3708 RepID=A0A816LMB9_BRANA|nr:unnamed protein product [Brassica napus]